jgi:hypothetical protein
MRRDQDLGPPGGEPVGKFLLLERCGQVRRDAMLVWGIRLWLGLELEIVLKIFGASGADVVIVVIGVVAGGNIEGLDLVLIVVLVGVGARVMRRTCAVARLEVVFVEVVWLQRAGGATDKYPAALVETKGGGAWGEGRHVLKFAGRRWAQSSILAFDENGGLGGTFFGR